MPGRIRRHRSMPLTAKQKKDLKGHAHNLKPVVLMGQNGLTSAVMDEIEQALDFHELIKVKLVAADRQEKTAMTASICDATQAELVQLIGHTGVFYRHNPDRGRYS